MPAACTWIWTSSSTGSPTSISSTLNGEFSSHSRAPLVFMPGDLNHPVGTRYKTVASDALTCIDMALCTLVRHAHRQAAVHDKLPAGRVRRLVGGQVDDAGRNLGRLGAAAQRDLQEVLRNARRHRGANQAGVDGIDPDVVRRQLQRG